MFLLSLQLLTFYKPDMDYLSACAVAPDKQRYMVAAEGTRHYIDIDDCGAYPFENLPHRWDSTDLKCSADTLQQHGNEPWWASGNATPAHHGIQRKRCARILKRSAELGH